MQHKNSDWKLKIKIWNLVYLQWITSLNMNKDLDAQSGFG